MREPLESFGGLGPPPLPPPPPPPNPLEIGPERPGLPSSFLLGLVSNPIKDLKLHFQMETKSVADALIEAV